MKQQHFALVLVDGSWYGMRELQQSDLSAIHMDPPPRNPVKRIQYQGEMVAGDRLTKPLEPIQCEHFALTAEKFNEINRAIISQNP